jgi:hypothetical protein
MARPLNNGYFKMYHYAFTNFLAGNLRFFLQIWINLTRKPYYMFKKKIPFRLLNHLSVFFSKQSNSFPWKIEMVIGTIKTKKKKLKSFTFEKYANCRF